MERGLQMTQYKVEIIYPDGEREIEDETFDSREEAEDYGQYMYSCCSLGGEILNMSNPGDYPESDDDADYEIIEID